MIVAAALRYNGTVYSISPPGQHCDVFQLMLQKGIKPPIIGEEQGFLTNEDQFVDRITAGRLAVEAKQILKLKHPPRLYHTYF